MASPSPPNPERKAAAAVNRETSASAASQETKKPTDSVPMATGTFAVLPAQFGRYRVEKLLGRGAMGAVYRARDTQLDRLVALKIPRVSASGSSKLLKRLEVEAKAAAKLHHPNICSVHDYGVLDSVHFIAMQYVDGEDLKTWLKRRGRPLEPAAAIRLMVKLASAVGEAHQQEIIHRDLKPENVMLRSDGEPVIMDFGLARRATGATDAGLTQGMIVGTAAYMSPEQANGRAEGIDHRSDIYALGVMLFELLTGAWPFTGSAFEVMGQKSVQEAPSPLSIDARIPPQLATVCHKMIARKKEDRYSTCADVVAAMEAIKLKESVPRADSQPAGLSLDFLSQEPAPTLVRRNALNPIVSLQSLLTPMAVWWSGLPPAVRWVIPGGAGALSLALAVILYFQTPYGVMQIEIEDPTLSVKFDGQTITIENDGQPIRVTATSQHTLEVLQGGLTVDAATQQLTVKQDEKQLVKVWLIDGQVVVNVGPMPVNVAGTIPVVDTPQIPTDVPPPAVAPFDTEQAKKHQDAWAKYLKVPMEYTNSLGMKFVLIPPGEFLMGSSPAEIDLLVRENNLAQEYFRSESPLHRVVLTKPIYLGIHEVTQAQYERLMRQNPSCFSPLGAAKERVAGMDTTSRPVEMVSWNDVAAFCAKLSELEQLRPFNIHSDNTVTPRDGTGYRLPTEAEWEFACRAGTTIRYWSGSKNDDLKQAGWFGTSWASGGQTHVVGGLKANPFGLYDVHGNAWEWVQDGWDPNYYGQFEGKSAIDPCGPPSADARRVIRGGCWIDAASITGAPYRFFHDQHRVEGSIGFRVALSVDAARADRMRGERISTQSSGKVPFPDDAGITGATSSSLATSDAARKRNQSNRDSVPQDTPPLAVAPFDTAQAEKHQEVWAAHIKEPVESLNSLGMKFRLIPPGEFTMGSAQAVIDDLVGGATTSWTQYNVAQGPEHRVRITRAFYLGACEVTRHEFQTVMEPSTEANESDETGTLPMGSVSWYEAVDFCNALSQREGLSPCYLRDGETVALLPGNGYRLPTEAEWEYACRAGTATLWHSGDNWQDAPRHAWYNSNSGNQPHPVAQLAPNPFGLFDMNGNVWEWCWDWYGEYGSDTVADPVGSDSGEFKIFRGGGFGDSWQFIRSASRFWESPSRQLATPGPGTGFRVVRECP